MVKKPAFKLLSDKKDITELLTASLISLNYEDKKDEEADELSFVVHGLYKNKPFGTNVELKLGMDDKLVHYGNFFIQTIAKDYVNNTTEVRATSVDFNTQQKERKTETWQDTNLKEITRKIAENNGMGYTVESEVEKSLVSKVLQENATDLGFLTVLASQRGFFLTVKDNIIIIRKHLDTSSKHDQNADLKQDKTVKISELYSLSVTEANRDVYGTVLTLWHNVDTNERRGFYVGYNKGTGKIDVVDSPAYKFDEKGEGTVVDPATTTIYTIETAQPKSFAEAFEMAKAKLEELQRGGKEGSFTTEGQEIRTGQILKIEKIGIVTVTNVSHSLTPSGYTITVSFEG
jgi:phage protein D